MRRFLLVILLLPQLLAAGSLSPEARQHLQAGLEAEKQQRLDTAIAEFRKVTELEPTLAAAFAKLGQALMSRGKFGEAIPPLKRAVELDDSLVPAHRLLGYAFLAQGFAKEAVPHLEKAKDKGALGIAQLELEQPAEAVANLQAAVAETPNDADLLFYLSRGSQMLATQSMDKLAAGFPGSARAHQLSGQNYFSTRQFADAEKEYRQALVLRPDLPGLHLELGQVYAEGAQWQAAAEEFRAEVERRPGSAEAAFRLGNALLQQGKAVDALVELKRADELRPDMTETLYALGKAASATGDDALAEKSWLRVTELEKQGSLASQAHFSLAALYRKQRKVELANQQMQAYHSLRHDSAVSPTPKQ